jgi:N-formylglutamate amidohydrolase
MQHGVAAVIARAPRAAIDCNRHEDEIDPTIIEGRISGRVSARARGGLGIVPSRTHQHGYLWRRSISRSQLDDRVEQAHRPYHQAIEAELRRTVDRFGCALLLDCHSMPPVPEGVPPIIFGDCHGRSAAPWVSAEAARIASSAGFSSALNNPFAGGHIIDRHSAPGRSIHALQVEVDRRCYLDASLQYPGKGFDQVASLFEELVTGLGSLMLGDRIATAAE